MKLKGLIQKLFIALFAISIVVAGCGGEMDQDEENLDRTADDVEQTDVGSTQADETDNGVTQNSEALTANDINKAIKWFQARKGSTAYEGMCEKAVENSFGRSGVFPTARDAYIYAKNKGYLHTSGVPPRGASVFYKTSYNQHIALAAGGWTVWSTSVNGRIGLASYSYFQHPLGWAVIPWR